MKYIVCSDIYYIFKEKCRIVYMYIFVLIAYFLLMKVSGGMQDAESIQYHLNHIFGLKGSLQELLMEPGSYILILLNYSIYAYVSLLILMKDFDNSDNLFLRINISRWVDAKIVAMIFMSFILNFILYGIALLFGSVDFSFFTVILGKILLSVSLCLCIYIMFLIHRKYKVLFGICLLTFLYGLWLGFDIYETHFLLFFYSVCILWILLKWIGYFIKFSDVKG